MRREVKVGIFLVGAFCVFAVAAFVVGNVSRLFQPRGYSLFVVFDSALGLDKSAAVRLAGIKIGYIKDIRLDLRKTRVDLQIFNKFRIPRGSQAAQATMGLLGEKYIEIRPGESDAFHAPGEELVGLPAAGLDQIGPVLMGVGQEIKELSASVRKLLSGETEQNLQQTLRNVSALTEELKALAAENRVAVGRVIGNADKAILSVDSRLQALTAEVDRAAAGLRGLIDENRFGVKENLDRLQTVLDKIRQSVDLLNGSLEKIRNGEGTLGRLVNDPGLYEKAEGAVGDVRKAVGPLASLAVRPEFRAEYFPSSERVRSSFSLTVLSDRRPVLLGAIVHDPWRDRFLYSAQGGWRFGGFAPRAGLIESAFGAGVDYYALRDRLVLSLEGFDFDRAESPQLRAAARFFPHRNVFFVLGLNDFASTSRSAVFFGLGLGVQ
jgi:phospholipid/cholesterol/gamma-HCH transport system substrate-binding protein